MESSFITIGLAFLEGLALIISPCILPILPFILSGSVQGGKKRPIGITIGFVTSFALFTLFSKKIVQWSGVDLNMVRDVSYILLALFGLVMISTYLTEKFNLYTSRLARIDSGAPQPNGLLSGIWFGCLVGLIWTPCAGPILATVLVQSILQPTTLGSFLTVLAFGIGAGIPMLVIAIFGNAIITKLGFFKRHSMVIRKLLGIIILASVAYIAYGDASFNITPIQSSQNDILHNELINGLDMPYRAPELQGVTDWINSNPLTMAELKGKVVLIDFWTYSCINCIRTLPYIKSWYSKYHDKGLVIIGVHTPEFEFEKNIDNIKNAVKKDGILYPVAVDNNYAVWQSFRNQYWPAHYLIDKNGVVVYTHFGEGEYDVTENNIRFLLGLNKSTEKSKEMRQFANETPETYLGYDRASRNMSPESVIRDGIGTYTYPNKLEVNDWAIEGLWNVAAQHITSAGTNAAIKIRFNAAKVYVVMGSTNGKPVKINLLLNGELLDDSVEGKDVHSSSMIVKDHTLYEVISMNKPDTGILEFTLTSPGVEFYTFTFGE